MRWRFAFHGEGYSDQLEWGANLLYKAFQSRNNPERYGRRLEGSGAPCEQERIKDKSKTSEESGTAVRGAGNTTHPVLGGDKRTSMVPRSKHERQRGRRWCPLIGMTG